MNEKDKKGIILIVGVVGVVIALMAARVAMKQEPLDERNCMGTPNRNTVFLIDKSDSITAQTQAEIEARIYAHIEQKVQTNELVSIFTVSQLSKNNLTPIISLCKPQNKGNIAHEDVKGIEARYHKKFIEPLRAVVSRRAESSPESPITQVITDLTLSKFLRADTNTLMIFSDMIEHVPGKYSMFSCPNQNEAIQTYKNLVAAGKQQPQFKNTKVYLNIIPRDDLKRGTAECRDKFWPWFFSSHGGNTPGENSGVILDYLPGGIVKIK